MTDGQSGDLRSDVSTPDGDVPAPDAGERWRTLLDLDAALAAKRGVRLLTAEARVLITLRLSGSLSIGAAMQAAGTSQRGFYAVLERLRRADLVATITDPEDQRVRRLSLSLGAEFGA